MVKLSYNTEEASEALGVPQETINKWRKLGVLRGIKYGTGYIYSHKELEKFLDDYTGEIMTPPEIIPALVKKKRLASQQAG